MIDTDQHFLCVCGFDTRLLAYRSGLESSKVEIEVYARRFFFNYKVIKKTESKESLADLLEHSETRVSCSFFYPVLSKRLLTTRR